MRTASFIASTATSCSNSILTIQSPPQTAYKSAVEVSEHQGARTYKLLASLSLARLYQSTGRPAEAHAVLAPALDGFSPTLEMPEIADAQALLTALAGTEEVKAAEAQRQRRLHLQTAYGQAMMWSKGFAAEETKVAFARASELAASTDNFAHASRRDTVNGPRQSCEANSGGCGSWLRHS